MAESKTPMLDKIGHEKVEDFIRRLMYSDEDVRDAVSKSVGLNRWFEGFVQSDIFDSLSREQRAESFSCFTLFFVTVDYIDTALADFKIRLASEVSNLGE